MIVLMNEYVAHAGDLTPGNPMIFGAKRIREPLDRFSKHEQLV